jgi:hypothetical protein
LACWLPAPWNDTPDRLGGFWRKGASRRVTDLTSGLSQERPKAALTFGRNQ